MNDFKVTVNESNGDISIYTNATSISVNSNKIVVDYEGRCAVHTFDETDEVTIVKNA